MLGSSILGRHRPILRYRMQPLRTNYNRFWHYGKTKLCICETNGLVFHHWRIEQNVTFYHDLRAMTNSLLTPQGPTNLSFNQHFFSTLIREEKQDGRIQIQEGDKKLIKKMWVRGKPSGAKQINADTTIALYKAISDAQPIQKWLKSTRNSILKQRNSSIHTKHQFRYSILESTRRTGITFLGNTPPDHPLILTSSHFFTILPPASSKIRLNHSVLSITSIYG